MIITTPSIIDNTEKYNLFLDDIRTPDMCSQYMYLSIHKYGQTLNIYHKENWVIVRSFGEFVECIQKNGLPKLISFDHDLADDYELRTKMVITKWFNMEENREYTGMDCAKYLIDYCLDNNKILPSFVVHSQNPSGNENIVSILNNFRKYQFNNKQ